MQEHQNLPGSLNVRFVHVQGQSRKNSLTKYRVQNCGEEKSLKPKIQYIQISLSRKTKTILLLRNSLILTHKREHEKRRNIYSSLHVKEDHFYRRIKTPTWLNGFKSHQHYEMCHYILYHSLNKFPFQDYKDAMFRVDHI